MTAERLERTLTRHRAYLEAEQARRGSGDVLQPGRERVIAANVAMIEERLKELRTEQS